MDNPVGVLNPYELNHLVEHLEQGGQVNAVLKLLQLEWVTGMPAARDRFRRAAAQPRPTYRNAWFAARSARGDIEGYAGDLGRALGMLDRELPLAPAERRPELVAAQIHCALAVASQQSRSDALPTALIERLLLAGKPYAVALARAIPAAGWCAKALALLVPHLPPSERAAVAGEVTDLIAAPEANIEYVAPVLRHVAPYLSTEDSRRIRRRLDDVRHRETRARVQGALAASMTEGELYRAIREMRDYPDSDTELALSGLAPHLSEHALMIACATPSAGRTASKGWPHWRPG